MNTFNPASDKHPYPSNPKKCAFQITRFTTPQHISNHPYLLTQPKPVTMTAASANPFKSAAAAPFGTGPEPPKPFKQSIEPKVIPLERAPTWQTPWWRWWTEAPLLCEGSPFSAPPLDVWAGVVMMAEERGGACIQASLGTEKHDHQSNPIPQHIPEESTFRSIKLSSSQALFLSKPASTHQTGPDQNRMYFCGCQSTYVEPKHSAAFQSSLKSSRAFTKDRLTKKHCAR